MKTNWLAFDILAAFYSVFGAIHEEKRLLQEDPQEFAEYQEQVAFFVGKPAQKDQ
jgi:protein-S-isoprenylcysteine O-methyltransferase Ste14